MTPIWIFAYGSLIWRPGFVVEEQSKAIASGFARRFWQGSHDHRGTSEFPGRVVTLINEPGSLCEGLVLRLPVAEQSAILKALDYREKDGYERVPLVVKLARGQVVNAITWVAKKNNPSWLGSADTAQLTNQIRTARGLSGSNVDYVLKLGDALEKLGIVDAHVQALIAALMDNSP